MAHTTAALALRADYDSPGIRFALYRIGDIVNELHDWELWITPGRLGADVGVSAGRIRAYLAQFVDDGWLEVMESGRGKGKPTRYRWARWPDEALFPGGDPTLGDVSGNARDGALDAPTEASRLLLTKDEPKRDAVEEEFDAIWPEYPRRIARKNALRAYRARRREGVSAEELARAVRAYGQTRVGEPERFTLHPSTFFGPSDRWRDYIGAGAVAADEVDLLAATTRIEDLL